MTGTSYEKLKEINEILETYHFEHNNRICQKIWDKNLDMKSITLKIFLALKIYEIKQKNIEGLKILVKRVTCDLWIFSLILSYNSTAIARRKYIHTWNIKNNKFLNNKYNKRPGQVGQVFFFTGDVKRGVKFFTNLFLSIILFLIF